jgi:hypothetical protein
LRWNSAGVPSQNVTRPYYLGTGGGRDFLWGELVFTDADADRALVPW